VMPTAKLPNQKLLSAAAPGPVGPERQKAGDALMLAVSLTSPIRRANRLFLRGK